MTDNAPVANADNYDVTENTPLTVNAFAGVLANDTDADGDQLTASLVSGPSDGTLQLNPDGSFTYTPNTGYTGTDSFEYQDSDGAENSQPVFAVLNVLAAPPPPPPGQNIWKPAGVNNLASNPNNWTGGVVPNGKPAVFDGEANATNQAIQWDKNISPTSITLQNGYTAQMTINAGMEVTDTGSIIEDAKSTLNVNFAANTSILAVQSGASKLTNFNFSGQGGFGIEDAASMNIGGNYSMMSTTEFDLVYGGTLAIATGKPLQLDGSASIIVSPASTLKLDGSGDGATLITADYRDGGLLNNMGTVVYTGAPGATTTIQIPVSNSGKFVVNGGGVGNKQPEAQLNIKGLNGLTRNTSFDMTGGSLELEGHVVLYLNDNYSQEGGKLTTDDQLVNELNVGSKGTIYGGSIVLGQGAGYGWLTIRGNLVMGGEYDAKINGNASGESDVLGSCRGRAAAISEGSHPQGDCR